MQSSSGIPGPYGEEDHIWIPPQQKIKVTEYDLDVYKRDKLR
jgi:hypothetical protein